MSNHKSFNNEKRKYQKMFDNNEQNTSDIKNNIKKFDVRYTSDTRYKSHEIIDVISDLQITTPGQLVTFDLIDFPEWAINMTRPNIVIKANSAYNIEKEVNFTEANANGTLQLGDIEISRHNIIHWFTKKDSVYTFTVRYDVRINEVTSKNQFGFSSTAIPIFSDIKLYILNERNFDEIQSGK